MTRRSLPVDLVFVETAAAIAISRDNRWRMLDPYDVLALVAIARAAVECQEVVEDTPLHDALTAAGLV